MQQRRFIRVGSIGAGVFAAMAALPLSLLGGCSVLAVGDAVVAVGSAAVSVAATTVKVGAKAVGAVVDAVTPESGQKEKK
jgi:predicted homoserine dehydrogenase-like protein